MMNMYDDLEKQDLKRGRAQGTFKKPGKKYRKPLTRTRLGNFFFGAAVLFLVIIIIATLSAGFSEIRSATTSNRYHADEDDYLRYISRRDFVTLEEQASSDRGIDRTLSPTEQEALALGDYTRAAALYAAYVTAGDEDHAAILKDRMDAARAAAREYGNLTEEIDALFLE